MIPGQLITHQFFVAAGNPPCRGNFLYANRTQRVVFRMININVQNKFLDEKLQKAPEIGKCV